MKVVGLLSGGKDSCYNLCHCVRQGHEIVAVATLAPPTGKDEIDSYMYQTVGHDAVHLVAQALGVPLYRKSIRGQPLNQDLQYRQASTSASKDETDETEDLFELLVEVKRNHLDVEAVSVGAILSNYQRTRVEHVCLRPELGLVPLTFLWQRSQEELLSEMIEAGLNAVLIKVAGIGLDERDLGRSLTQMRPKLQRLNTLYGAHVCGEGGEYETLTLDCPLFKHRIELIDTEVVTHAEAAFASVAYLKLTKARLVQKNDSAPDLSSVRVPEPLDDLSRQALDAVAKVPRSAAVPSAESSTAMDADQSQRSMQSDHQPRLTRSGHWISASNVHGLTEEGKQPESLEQETQNMLERLHASLQEQGLTLRHVTHINLYLASQTFFLRVNAIYKTMFAEGPPSRACVGVSPACDDVRRVFLDAVATDEVQDQRSLHVQGRSYWAPANIGPYSQAMLARERISIAGQIGLRPANLALPEEDFDEQAVLSLQHARRIHLAVLDGAAVKPSDAHIEGGICWIESAPPGHPVTLATRVAKAQAAWAFQHHGTFEDEENSEAEDPALPDWLGLSSTASTLPMLFAIVQYQGLPRGAGIEWQLTGCTGRSVATDRSGHADSDENDDMSQSSSVTRASLDLRDDTDSSILVSWSRFSCPRSQSTFGIISMSRVAESNQSQEAIPAESSNALQDVRTQLASAFSIRAFSSASATLHRRSRNLTVLEALHLLEKPSSASATPDLQHRASLIDVDDLFVSMDGRDMRAIDVAVVWMANNE